jgi:hypothetical protein
MSIGKRNPLTLPSPAGWRGKNGDERNLTAPLTFILSRKGREEMEGKILKDPSPLPSPVEWREEQKDEKILTSPHPTLARGWLCHNPCFACDYAKNTVKK